MHLDAIIPQALGLALITYDERVLHHQCIKQILHRIPLIPDETTDISGGPSL